MIPVKPWETNPGLYCDLKEEFNTILYLAVHKTKIAKEDEIFK